MKGVSCIYKPEENLNFGSGSSVLVKELSSGNMQDTTAELNRYAEKSNPMPKQSI